MMQNKVLITLLIIAFSFGCNEEQLKENHSNELLVGRWNSYEQGDSQNGFAPGPTTSLTIMYDSGIKFLADGTFKLRWYHFSDETWSETNTSIGIYEIRNGTILLTYSPGTADEYKLELQLVKLDNNHLWFKHSIFGPEQEHHLEKVGYN